MSDTLPPRPTPIPPPDRHQIERLNDLYDLSAVALSMLADPQRLRAMRGVVRNVYESHYTAAANYDQLIAIYQNASMPQLVKTLDVIKRAFELGEVDIHRVIQTRVRLLQTTLGYLDARERYYQTLATLEALVGTEIVGIGGKR